MESKLDTKLDVALWEDLRIDMEAPRVCCASLAFVGFVFFWFVYFVNAWPGGTSKGLGGTVV